MSNISQFVSHIKKSGIASSNRFNVVINIPNILIGKVNGDTPTTLHLSAQSLTLSGYNVSTQNLRIQNETRQIAYDKNDSEFDITFLCTGSHEEKKIFDMWKRHMFRTDHTVEYYDDYVADVTVQLLNQRDEVVYETTVIECYPATVGTVTPDRTARDAILTLNVVFNYMRVLPDHVPSTIAKSAQLSANADQGTADTASTDNEFVNRILNVIGSGKDPSIQYTSAFTERENPDISATIKGIK